MWLHIAVLITVPVAAWDIVLKSPAKINLFLRVLGKYRETKYHSLVSLFHTISLSDILQLQVLPSSSASDVLTCSDPVLEREGRNLITAALDLMRQKTNSRKYFTVHLEKKIPMQAGLGGGSSNAATAMYAFNQLTRAGATMDEMKCWSQELGSDVPFFFSTGCALCSGRGEEVQSLSKPLRQWGDALVHVIKPRSGLSTATVFEALKMSQCSTAEPAAFLAAYEQQGVLEAPLLGAMVNDLEGPAFRAMPLLSSLKQDCIQAIQPIERGAGCMMTGSGSAMIVLADGRQGDGGKGAVETVAQSFGEDIASVHTCRLILRGSTESEWY